MNIKKLKKKKSINNFIRSQNIILIKKIININQNKTNHQKMNKKNKNFFRILMLHSGFLLNFNPSEVQR